MLYEWVMLLLFEQGRGRAGKITWMDGENHPTKPNLVRVTFGFQLSALALKLQLILALAH
jgi:hypothetical protein